MFNKRESKDMGKDATQDVSHPNGESQQYPPLEAVNRPMVPTEQAAFYLLRRPQTLRGWACNEDGPIRPIRIGNRLGWPVAEIRRVVEGKAIETTPYRIPDGLKKIHSSSSKIRVPSVIYPEDGAKPCTTALASPAATEA